MNVAIIGTGFLGEQLYTDLLPVCERIVLTHHTHQKFPESKRFDFFTDDIADIFGDEKIDTVFLPTRIEFEEDEEKLTQAMTRFLTACKGSRIVYVSSDGIFDGMHGLYREGDAANPTTLYGRNLKICEDLVRNHADNHCILRPSYLYGFVGGRLDKRLDEIRSRVAKGEKIVRFTDMYKSPLSYQQTSEAIVKLALSEFVGTAHVCGERMSVFDLSKQGMDALGLPTEKLTGEQSPDGRKADFLADTSLTNDLMVTLTGMHPWNIKEGLVGSNESFADDDEIYGK